jgi:type IV secretion system protein VirD4
LEAVERAMGLMAGYGIQLWPILQDMSQLKDLYCTKAGTFIANAGVRQVFGVNDLETARWLSQPHP